MIKIKDKFGINDRYEILSILGEGGMGIVYKAYDNMLKEYVAIKTLNVKLSSDESIKNRFINEAKICLSLTHPNIIRVRDVSIYNDIYYMVMEYIDGIELKEILHKQKKDDIKSLYLLIKPILQALSFAHQYTIHRDIKPSNIMIKDSNAYLMDFGISKALETSQLDNCTEIGGMGTRKYASPEQIFNANDVDNRSDIYSMGIVLYELFTGVIPKNTAIEKCKKPSYFNKKITNLLDNVILKMIDSDINNRYKSIDEVIKLLDNIFNNKLESIITNTNVEHNIKNMDLNLDDMVLIEEGNFLRGSGIESKIKIEKPRKSVYVDKFYISKYCVTNEQYNEFLKQTNYNKPNNFDELLKEKPEHPVVFVSYLDAIEYCKYNNCTLPTEAQWEKAAKGAKNNIYPWGNEFDQTKVNISHFNNETNGVFEFEEGKTQNDIYNLAGNVWEWCLDDFIEDYYKNDNIKNPLASNNSNIKVLRGGSFDFISTAARTSFRFNSQMNSTENNIGFRVVKNDN